MAGTLAEIRAELAKQAADAAARQAKNSTTQTRKSFGDSALFPFWNLNPGETALWRMLPDGDESNLFPWRKKMVFEIPFNGVVGAGEKDTDQEVKVKFVSPITFRDVDPDYKIACQITSFLYPYWKEAKESEKYKLAQKYNKQTRYLMQGTISDCAFEEENPPENPIRRIQMNKRLFENRILRAYNGTDFQYSPHEYDNGTDFRFEVTKNGPYKDYDISNFVRNTRSLNEAERAAIETHGLFKLVDFIGKRPSATDADVQFALFKDSIDGKPYDFASYGEVYAPSGFNSKPAEEGSDASTSSGSTNSGSGAVAATPKAETASASAPASNPDDLIARIRRSIPAKAE
jgi:hypothetical protein